MQSIHYLTFGELFCGAGGLAYGAITADSVKDGQTLKIKHAWANDIDPSSCETYRYNIAKDAPNSVICSDVHTLDFSQLTPIDIFAYGFPCNDFSIVGEHRGLRGAYGGLYQTGVAAIDYFKPIAFVAENVGGIRSADEGKAFKQILDDLQSAGNGYTLTVHLYKAEEYGVPQTRHRFIIVGFDKSTGLRFRVPSPTHLKRFVTAREALANIPPEALNQERGAVSALVIERLKHIRPGENAWTADLPPHLRLNVKAAKLSQIYRRLHPDKPSYTITASGGGGTHGYHYDEPRPLTNRERARLQTFPDEFIFCGTKEQVRKQIGMAVPPLLSRAIFTAILKTIHGIPYPAISANYDSPARPSIIQPQLF